MNSEYPSSSLIRFSEDAIIEVIQVSSSQMAAIGQSLDRSRMVGDASSAWPNAATQRDIHKSLENSPTAREVSRRAFDVACAFMGLAVLVPILLIVAAAIKLEDGGPVLFSQPRVGKGLTKFRLLKFRSMIPNAGGSNFLTAPGDPRVTRVGRFLRKYKLDELPQLANVVRGEMQLVGVRPQVECFVKMFPGEYALLLQERPGITGLATLVFRNEEQMFQSGSLEKQYVSQMLPRKLSLALQYRHIRTFFSDLEILFRTVLGFKYPTVD